MARTVLLCDDELHIMRAIEVRLRGANYNVLLAGDGEEAWQFIQRNVPDLLITDVAMPRLDGFELCKRIREHQHAHKLPIFFLTARGGDFDHAEVKQKWGILDILAKPFSPRDVLRRVDSVFAGEAAVCTAMTCPGQGEPGREPSDIRAEAARAHRIEVSSTYPGAHVPGSPK